jgi:hypothetical protein
MVNERPAQNDEDLECATCGHPGKFHPDSTSTTKGRDAEKRPCVNPEDGSPCTCQDFRAA